MHHCNHSASSKLDTRSQKHVHAHARACAHTLSGIHFSVYEINMEYKTTCFKDLMSVICAGCVSESGDLQHCFFWFGNNGADAAIAILLPI
jgi:hypothetical protein